MSRPCPAGARRQELRPRADIGYPASRASQRRSFDKQTLSPNIYMAPAGDLLRRQRADYLFGARPEPPQALLRPVASWQAQPHDRLPSSAAKVPGSGRLRPAGRPGEVVWMHAGSAAAGAGWVTGGLGGQLGAAGHCELGEDVGQVGLHCRPAHEQG